MVTIGLITLIPPTRIPMRAYGGHACMTKFFFFFFAAIISLRPIDYCDGHLLHIAPGEDVHSSPLNSTAVGKCMIFRDLPVAHLRGDFSSSFGLRMCLPRLILDLHISGPHSPSTLCVT